VRSLFLFALHLSLTTFPSTALVQSILKRGGRVLLPVFALGRAQELLLILDEYWAEHPELQHIPIYYISSLAIKCMDVYRQCVARSRLVSGASQT